MAVALGLTLLGLVLLVLGGEGAVRGGSALAARFNVQPYIIGATVVAFGTSTPELAVTVTAALRDEPGLALGNVVGSNIANLGLILGLSAIITPILMLREQTRREVPVLVGVVALLLLFAWDRRIEWWEGVLLLIAMSWVMWQTIRSPRMEQSDEDRALRKKIPLMPAFLFVLGGLVGLISGGYVLVEGAVQIAEYWGVPEWVIAVVIVAAGTSMPEVAASVVAAIRGHGEIALGNVIGSNTFNALLVLGAGSVLRPIGVRVDISLDLAVVTLFTLVPAITLWTRSRMPRWAGWLLLAGYMAYIVAKVAVR